MPIFVSYSFASMENDNALFGSGIIDKPVVTEIASEHDIRQLEAQVLAGFGMPDSYRWVVISNWKWLPESLSIGDVNVTGEFTKATLDSITKAVSA